MTANSNDRLLVSVVLQVIVGAIVILGGAALIYFSADATGKALGVIHATLGVAGFSAGILLWAKKSGARVLTILADVLIIGFSAASEAVLSVTGSLPTDQFVDSIAGTIAAIVLAIAIVALSPRSKLNSSPEPHGSSAGP